MAELADLEDVATEAAFQAAQMEDQARLQRLRQHLSSLQLLHPPLMTHRRNQLHLQGMLILRCVSGQWSFSFQQGRLVLVQNLKSIRLGTLSTMVNGLQKNMLKSCIKQHRLVTIMHGIEKLEEAERQNQEYVRSMNEWKAEVESQGFKDHPSVPHGPPPKGTSSMRALPNVHEALRQNDPSKAPASQPILPKKAPPTTGRGRPAAFYSGDEPPRIGSAPVQPPPPPKPSSMWEVQPQGMFHPPTATPMTPGYPPRPPVEALPKPVPEVASQPTLKHPLPEPAQQGPPNKQVRHKAFPKEQQASLSTSMASPSAVDMSRMSAPSPKGPPASFNSRRCSAHVFMCSRSWSRESQWASRIYRVRSPSDIDWSVKEQLEPNLKVVQASPRLKNCACSAIPKMDRSWLQADLPAWQHHPCCSEDQWHALLPHARSCSMGAQWNPLVQSIEATNDDCHMVSRLGLMRQSSSTWCSILQVHFEDFIPRYQIFVEQEEDVDKLVQHWQEPTTLWDGQPVIGFMAETYLDDLRDSWFQALQSNVVISNYLCQPELGSDDARDGSMAPCRWDR